MTELRIADTLQLPIESVTQTFAVVGVRGSGKTHTTSVLIEELIGAGMPVVVIDPLDAWWGLRSSADGKAAGLPVVIAGGEHGDIPLEASAGTVLADVIVDERISMVLSLRHLSKTKQRTFVAEFCERIYHRKGESSHREPLHVAIDEADAFVPQRVASDTARVMGAVDDLVRRGRSSGFGVSLITQRPATIHKDVLSQAEVLIAHRLIAPQDRKALESWIEAHDAHGQGPELLGSLASLPVGTAWFWSPGWLDIFDRVKVRPRSTFDSSATPKVGQRAARPTAFADVDLAVLSERIAATIERSAADDPRALRRRIAELEQALASQEPSIERVEVPVILDGHLDELEDLANRLSELSSWIGEQADRVTTAIDQVRRPALAAPSRPVPATPRQAAKPVSPRATTVTDGQAAVLKPGAMSMLRALASVYPLRLTRSQLATMAGVSLKSSSWPPNLSTLRQLDYIDEDSVGYSATEEGLAALGADAPRQPHTAAEIQALWRSRLKGGAQRMLDVLVERYPASLPRHELAAASQQSITSSSFGGHLSLLRNNGLIEVDGDQVRAGDVLFMAGGER